MTMTTTVSGANLGAWISRGTNRSMSFVPIIRRCGVGSATVVARSASMTRTARSVTVRCSATSTIGIAAITEKTMTTTDAECDLGLTVDMLDVDRLREWARLLLVHGADIGHWGSVPFVAGKMQTLATCLEKAIRDIGTLRSERLALRSALVSLVGVDGREDLEAMEGVMRLMAAPAQDKAATIDAIHALISTLPNGTPAADAVGEAVE